MGASCYNYCIVDVYYPSGKYVLCHWCSIVSFAANQENSFQMSLGDSSLLHRDIVRYTTFGKDE